MIIWKKVKKDFIKKNASNEFNSKKWLSIISKRLKTNFKIIKNKKYLNQFIASSPLPIMLLNEKNLQNQFYHYEDQFAIHQSFQRLLFFLLRRLTPLLFLVRAF